MPQFENNKNVKFLSYLILTILMTGYLSLGQCNVDEREIDLSESSTTTISPKNITKKVKRRKKKLKYLRLTDYSNYITAYSPIKHLNVPQILNYYGYPAESHEVLTEDGYYLTMFRIPYPKNATRKGVVFFQHGFFGVSFEWIGNIKKNILPLKMSDEGYDVWIGNCRGTTYSRKHANLTIYDHKFFEYSQNEMGKYDLPVVLDHVLKTSEEEKIHYVGFSMGTSQLFILLHYHPEYNEKIKLMTALAPIAYVDNIPGGAHFVSVLFQRIPIIKQVVDFIFNGELFPPYIVLLIQTLAKPVCSIRFLAATVCNFMAGVMLGYNPKQLLISQIPGFMAHFPGPTSTQTAWHFLQHIDRGTFDAYDYGTPKRNMRHYGQPTPPVYNLKNVKIPVAMFYGLGDALDSPKDVERLKAELPNCVHSSPIDHEFWSHGDYYIGRDADKLVNERVFKIISEYP